MKESRGKESAGEGFGLTRYESSSSPTRNRICARVVFCEQEAKGLDLLLLNFFDSFHWRCLLLLSDHHYSHKERHIHLDVYYI